METKTAIQSCAKGPINISVCSGDGTFIQLANSSKIKSIDLTGWCLWRKVDDSPAITYSFPSGFILQSEKTVKIYANDQKEGKSISDLVLTTHDSWGAGTNIVTRLLNQENEEKAMCIQKTLPFS